MRPGNTDPAPATVPTEETPAESVSNGEFPVVPNGSSTAPTSTEETSTPKERDASDERPTESEETDTTDPLDECPVDICPEGIDLDGEGIPSTTHWDRLHMRSGPGTQYEKEGHAPHGAPFVVLHSENGWSFI